MSNEFYIGLGRTETWPDISHAPPSSLTYDDVIIPPRNSEIESRRDIDTSVQFGPYTLRVPVVSAPMDTVTGMRMVMRLASLGAIGALPRGLSNVEDVLLVAERLSNDKVPCLYSIGLSSPVDDARKLKERGAEMVLIDVAHGGMEKVKRTAGEIKNKLDMFVVAGNIATYEQAKEYKKYGIDYARVGVGPGGACTTRIQTGVGFPQLSAIFETTEAGIFVIADGGIRQPGDAAKALAAGAKMIMIGSMLAGTDEAPGRVKNGMKYFRGQASKGYMNDRNNLADWRTEEGIETMVPLKGPAEKVLIDIIGGIRSGMSYVGARNLDEFRERAQFALVSSAALQEAQPHVVYQSEKK